MVCTGQHLCASCGCVAEVVDLIVKTESCSGCATGNKEEGLQVQLTGLLGLADCITDNLDNPDAHDYGSGSVAHFGKNGGLGGCMVCWPDCTTDHLRVCQKLHILADPPIFTLFMDPIEQEYIH